MSEQYSTFDRAKSGEIIRGAFPMALSFTFSFMVALIGPIAGYFSSDPDEKTTNLAAASLISVYVNTLGFVATSGLFAVSSIVSGAKGKLSDSSGDGNDSQMKINQALRSGTVWAMAASCLSFPMLYYSETILGSLGQSENAAAKAQSFLRPYAVGMPFFIFRIFFEQVMFPYGDNKRVMWMALSSFSFAGLPLALGLGFAKGYEFKGLGYGFAAEAALTSLLFGGTLLFGAKYKNLSFRGCTSCDSFCEFLKQASLFTLPIIVEQAALLVLNLIVGYLSERQLAAQNFVLQVIFLSILLQFSIATQSAILMKKNMDEAKAASLYASTGLITNLVVCFVFSAVLAGIGAGLSSGHDTFHYAWGLLIMTPFIQLAETANFTAATHLRFAGKSLQAAVRPAIGRWVGVGLGAIAGFLLDAKVWGVNGGYLLGFGLGFFVSVLNYWRESMAETSLQQSTGLIPASQ